jgi:1-acyl-sn-glycerol-3-phosphate acyltransferase
MLAFIGVIFERITRIFIHILLDLYMFGYNRVTYHHRERLTEIGPCIIVANHSSHYDAAVLLSAFPYTQMHRIHPVAAKDYFFSTKTQGFFFRIFMNVLPIERSAKMNEAFVPTEDAIQRGHSIIIFPEGTRSKTGEVGNFKMGVGYLASKYKMPVMPVYIDGAYRAFGKGSSLPKAHKISVVYGRPLYFEGDAGSREEWKVFASGLREEIIRVKKAFLRAKDNFTLFKG